MIVLSFISPTFGKVTEASLAMQVHAYMKEDPNASYRIVIGTDSQTNKNATVFVTAFIIHRIGKGARFYFQKSKHPPMKSLHRRIYKETELSLNLMEFLKNSGISKILADWPVEIHLDVGKEGETRKLIQEVVGWVTAVGYVARIKPYAYGASAVADKYTKSIG